MIKASLYPFLFVKIQQDKLKLTMTCQRDTIKGHHADADDHVKIRIKRAQAKLKFLNLTRFKNEVNWIVSMLSTILEVEDIKISQYSINYS